MVNEVEQILAEGREVELTYTVEDSFDDPGSVCFYEDIILSLEDNTGSLF
jgi:hypothetical protein